MLKKQKISIIGASGLVGRELSLLIKHATRFSTTEQTDEIGEIYSINQFVPREFDLVFLCTPSSVSEKLVPICLQANCMVIDLSSAYRLEKSVPLVIPEINEYEITQQTNLIASPNCTASILAMAIYPLHRIWKLTSLRLCTYQAASGGGKKLLDNLLEDTKMFFSKSVRKGPAFSCYPHESIKDKHGYCEEEIKIIQETKKILQIDIPIRPFCARVPSLRVHSLAIEATFYDKVDPLHAISAINNMPGVCYTEDGSSSLAEKKSEVFCTNLRKDLYDPNTLNFWAFGDQLLKGAALNALQIANSCSKLQLV